MTHSIDVITEIELIVIFNSNNHIDTDTYTRSFKGELNFCENDDIKACTSFGSAKIIGGAFWSFGGNFQNKKFIAHQTDIFNIERAKITDMLRLAGWEKK